MKKLRVIALALLVTGLVAAGPARATDPVRSPRGNNRPTWQLDGGTPTAKGVSVDAGKRSNAYAFATAVYDTGGNPVSGGGYVYPKGYIPPLKDGSWGFSYITANLVGAGQVFFAIGLDNGDWVYLDPYHCPGSSGGAWTTTDFKQVGSACTIYTSSGSFQGTDAVVNPDTSVTPATSAWSHLVAAIGTQGTWSFLTSQAAAITVDRVSVGGSTISEF